MNKAIVFDLDGTLWDSSREVCVIWNEVFSRRPETAFRMTREVLAGLMGKTMEEIGTVLFPALDAAFRRQIMDECGREEVRYLRVHGAVLYPKLRETLEILKADCGLYIVSNCQDGYVEAFLTAHGFADVFRDIEMSGRTGLGKGENIRLLLERNGVDRAVYVGDTGGDEKAARDAGIPFIFAAYGFGQADRPDRMIRSFKELPEAVRELGL